MNTPASAVVPSREAVEEMATLCEMCNDDAVAVMLRTLLTEVERLNTHAERLSRINREVLAESELLSATVADQGALIKQWEARCQAAWDQGDKDGDEMRGMAIKLADQAAALAERDKDAERYRWLRKCDLMEAKHHLAHNDEDCAARIDAALAASVSSASEEGGNG